MIMLTKSFTGSKHTAESTKIGWQTNYPLVPDSPGSQNLLLVLLLKTKIRLQQLC
jgi:hypothetical protein